MAVAGGGGQTCHVILLPLSRACHMNIIFYFMLETIKRTASFIHVPVANIIFHTNLKFILDEHHKKITGPPAAVAFH